MIFCADPSRRHFLRAGSAAALLLSANKLLAAGTHKQRQVLDSSTQKELRLFNTHTHEELSVVYKTGNQYHKENLLKLDHFLRDHRANISTVMDPKLYDQMWQIQKLAKNDDVFEVVSGFRSKATNDQLRRSSSNVAKKSFHMLGRAIDIRLRGCDCANLKDIALSLEAGGVGFYPASDFIHIDTGPVRYWS